MVIIMTIHECMCNGIIVPYASGLKKSVGTGNRVSSAAHGSPLCDSPPVVVTQPVIAPCEGTEEDSEVNTPLGDFLWLESKSYRQRLGHITTGHNIQYMRAQDGVPT